MEEIFLDIPSSNSWGIIKPIKEGWSDDLKYYIKSDNGTQFLLRISDSLSFEKESILYSALGELNEKDILTSKLIDSGICNQGKNTFRIFSWIDGIEIKKELNNFSEKEQYELGLQAGLILKEIHQIKSPENRIGWNEFYNKKINTKIEKYKNCGIAIKKSAELIAYIETHRTLLKNRPQSFHHGDFHVGNMLVTPQKELAIIDFNRLDFGDPWEEFNRITWTAEESVWFANGQINGYFNNNVPPDFFNLLALYIGVNQLGSIPWAIPFGEKQVKILLNQTERIFEWFDNFTQAVPSWYQPIDEI
ncbi:MAG: aminoglycoside phosphotransferase family protein [Saprospiraceae bacterium]